MTWAKSRLIRIKTRKFCKNSLERALSSDKNGVKDFLQDVTSCVENSVCDKILHGQVEVPNSDSNFDSKIENLKVGMKNSQMRRELSQIKAKDSSYAQVISSVKNSLGKSAQQSSRNNVLIESVSKLSQSSTGVYQNTLKNHQISSSLSGVLHESGSEPYIKHHKHLSRQEIDKSFEKIKQEKRRIRKMRYQRWKRQKAKIEKELKEDEERVLQKQRERKNEQKHRREELLKRIKAKKSLTAIRTEKDTKIPSGRANSGERPLFKKLEMDFKKKYILPELDRSRQMLKQRKELMKSIKISDLKKHQKKYMSDLDSKLKILKKKREENMPRIQNLGEYKSKIAQMLEEKQVFEDMEAQKKYTRNKMMIYGKMVSESHRPKISLKKQEELHGIIENLSHKPRKPNLSCYDRTTPIYLQKVKGKRGKFEDNAYNNIVSTSTSSKRMKRNSRNMNHSIQSQVIPKRKKIESVKHHLVKKSLDRFPGQTPTKFPISDEVKSSKLSEDYNSKMRMKRQRREEETGQRAAPSVVNMLVEAIDKEDEQVDMNLLKEKVKMLEEHANMKEKVLDSKGTEPEAYDEVNDLIITSIKTKLAMLKGI